ncbi:DUF1345 domain-containing protein [Salinispora vitiensis]|uniref:DUF1345 domain-containing protein n=1 Tax=Salinispora vitiensis TaxID=999544 RepID=UPI0003658159|nr:DUF1345 domain-containing protein [Salinispora vitiensis]
MAKITFAMSRLIEVTLIALGVFIILWDQSLGYIALWDLTGMLYLAIRIRRLRGKRGLDESDAWLKRTLGPRLGLLFTIFASLVGITAGIVIVMGGDNELETLIAKGVGVPTVLLAWGILHFGYAERYAQSYYAALPTKTLVFPNTDRPSFIDFTYLSFSIGATFAIPDVETQNSKVRLGVLSHAILSFIYNTATIGIVVSVITS